MTFGLETIYKDANFFVNENDKVGLVGVNGAGKTTLFKVILKEQELNSGKIILPKGIRIGYLPQEIKLNNVDTTVFEYLMSARPIEKLESNLQNLYEQVAVAPENMQKKILKKIGMTQEMLEYYDVYNAENILFELVEKMNIDSNLLDMKLNDLSGGQKSKIAFAHLLYSKPEILLLDEPTNHLDESTRKYVTDYLNKYKGMVIIISHDIKFLDAITNKTLYLNKSEHIFKVYDGSYSIFQKKLAQEQELKKRQIKKQELEMEKLRSTVLLYSNSSGKRKRMAQSREKTLKKMEKNKISNDKIYKRVKLNISPSRDGSKIPIKVNNINFGYDNSNLLYNNLSFVINNKERFLIVGENGIGKSTLLKLLINELKPLSGNIWYGNKTDIAYYAQEQENLNLNKTILENVDTKGYSEKELRNILGGFLFYGDDVYKKVEILSPGEKARIALCKIMLQRANLLILDEPTNHLDPETQQIIGENFKNYEGTIILVSHNISFVESIGIDRMLILPSGKITNYSNKLLEYYAKVNSDYND